MTRQSAPHTRNLPALLVIMLTLGVTTACWSPLTTARADDDDMPIHTENAVNAPEFPKDFAWLNTNQPLQFRQEGAGGLKGQVVLLDFWTYCCINCIHVLPDLDYLEQKFKDEPFVVIGVHSAKFANEGQVANVRSAIQRYNVHHPVIVDQEMKIWESFAIRSWPTLVLVGPDGRIVGYVSGEGNRSMLERAITQVLKDSREKGLLAKAPLKLQREGMVQSASGLAFPSKVLADEPNKRLFIADSNHNRILITTWPDAATNVSITAIIGSGERGQADADFTHATFNRPQGMTLAGDILYVADTENHLIRRVDLKKQSVITVLGTGKQVFDVEGGKSGRNQPLNSPWDVAARGTTLYISMAGQHQIWAANTLTWMAEPFAGTGREDIYDGPGADANLAQPSGLALDAANNRLYFADSEVSAVRYIDLPKREVHTIIGHGLFAFGDVDGDEEKARFQHPLGVALWGDKLLVADTYNHKIRLVDPAAQTAATLLGTGHPSGGDMNGPAGFYEPASIAVVGDTLFIADTDNHRIVVADAKTKSWHELVIDGLDNHETKMATEPALDAKAMELSPTAAAAFQLFPKLDAGQHLTPGAPISVEILAEDSAAKPDAAPRTLLRQTLTDATDLPLKITLPASQVAAGLSTDSTKPVTWLVRVIYASCSDGPGAVCSPHRTTWRVPVKSAAATTASIELRE